MCEGGGERRVCMYEGWREEGSVCMCEGRRKECVHVRGGGGSVHV